ncbi:MAG: flagellar protein FliT [Chromatiales bacterium]
MLLDGVMRLSDQIRDSARQANWKRVVELESERATLLGRLRTLRLHHDTNATTVALLHALLARNEELLMLCRMARKQLGVQMRALAQRRRIRRTFKSAA